MTTIISIRQFRRHDNEIGRDAQIIRRITSWFYSTTTPIQGETLRQAFAAGFMSLSSLDSLLA